MICLKCGRETAEGQSFCQECLLDMERYPVRPGTVVVLPKRRPVTTARKVPRRRGPSLEEQVRVLRRRVRLLVVCLALALALAGFLAYPAVRFYLSTRTIPGQNYSTVVTPAASQGQDGSGSP